jgi:choline dehydrogenase-like flavoprotein
MAPNAQYDAVVIGVGAAGSVFVSELTQAGFKVLAIEFGGEYRDHRSEFQENELAMWPLVWDSNNYDVVGDFQGVPNLGCGVGGGTLAWTAVSLRLFEHDFELKRRFGAPAGTSVEDWPFRLAELAPYYTRAERQMGVSGSEIPWGARGQLPPNPPLPLYPGSVRLSQAMSRLGIRSSAGRIATNSRPYLSLSKLRLLSLGLSRRCKIPGRSRVGAARTRTRQPHPAHRHCGYAHSNHP